MKKIYQFLWLLFLILFSFGQLQRFQLKPNLALYGHDLVLLLWLGLSLFTHRPQWLGYLKKIKNKPLYLTFIAWVCLGLSYHFLSSGFLLSPLLFIGRICVYLLATLSLKFIKPFSSSRQKQLWLLTGLFITLLGLSQYFLLPDQRSLRFLGWDDHYYRLIGTLFDPNFTGLLLVMILFLLTSFKQNSWLKRIGLLLIGLAISLTYSRATYLSLVLAGGILALIELKQKLKKSNWLYLVIILVVLSLPFLPKPGGEGVNLSRTYSITSRTQSSQSALTQLSSFEWLIGRGWFVPFEEPSLKTVADTAHFPDNLLIFSLASTGLVGLVLMLLILSQWAKNLYKNDIFIFSAFIAVIIHSQVNHSLFQPFIFLLLLNLSHLAKQS